MAGPRRPIVGSMLMQSLYELVVTLSAGRVAEVGQAESCSLAERALRSQVHSSPRVSAHRVTCRFRPEVSVLACRS